VWIIKKIGGHGVDYHSFRSWLSASPAVASAVIAFVVATTIFLLPAFGEYDRLWLIDP